MRYNINLLEAQQQLEESVKLTTTKMVAMLARYARSILGDNPNIKDSKLDAYLIDNAYTLIKNQFKKEVEKLDQKTQQEIIYSAVDKAKDVLKYIKPKVNEMAELEYGPDGVEISDGNAIENYILKTIAKAFSANQRLRELFDMDREPYDVQVEKIGPNIRIVLTPENGEKRTAGLFPMSYISKYIGNPEGMASFLLLNY